MLYALQMPDQPAFTDEELWPLRERYVGKPVPPCPVCGAPRAIWALGGSSVKYACSTLLGDAEVRSAADDLHWQDSAYSQYKVGDVAVLRLIDAYVALRDAN